MTEFLFLVFFFFTLCKLYKPNKVLEVCIIPVYKPMNNSSDICTLYTCIYCIHWKVLFSKFCRTPGTGLYDNLRQYRIPYPQAIFDIDYFERNPKPFYTLAKELYPSGKYRPNYVHYFIRMLHEKGLLLRLYTQNIDGLERSKWWWCNKLFVTGLQTDLIWNLPTLHLLGTLWRKLLHFFSASRIPTLRTLH